MKHVSSYRIQGAAWSVIAALTAGLFVSLSGCSSGDDDSQGVSGSGGTTGGSNAMAGTGSALGGASGTGSAGAGQTLTVNCVGTTYADALSTCTEAGCHWAQAPASGMNLTPDSGLVGRLKDVPAKHEDIFCPDIGEYCTTPPSTCPAPGTVLLVDSADYTKSWILAKIDSADPMCGDPMPGGAYNTPNDKACIEAMVQAIAALPK